MWKRNSSRPVFTLRSIKATYCCRWHKWLDRQKRDEHRANRTWPELPERSPGRDCKTAPLSASLQPFSQTHFSHEWSRPGISQNHRRKLMCYLYLASLQSPAKPKEAWRGGTYERSWSSTCGCGDPRPIPVAARSKHFLRAVEDV